MSGHNVRKAVKSIRVMYGYDVPSFLKFRVSVLDGSDAHRIRARSSEQDLREAFLMHWLYAIRHSHYYDALHGKSHVVVRRSYLFKI